MGGVSAEPEQTRSVPARRPRQAVADDAASRSASAVSNSAANLAHILQLRVPVSATLAEQDMSVETILGITVGTIIEFDALADAELNLNVANRSIGGGHAVKVGENFGLRITRIDTVQDRIDAMSGH